jgi:hypothetical protein
VTLVGSKIIKLKSISDNGFDTSENKAVNLEG